MALDENGDAVAAQGLEHRPGGKATRAARQLGDIIGRVAPFLVGAVQIAGGLAHGAAVRGRIANDREAAVVGRLKPFVAVERPAVGKIDMLGEMAAGRRSPGPQAKCAVDMMPGVEPARDFGRGGEIVERTGVDMASLRNHDRRTVNLGGGRAKRVGAHHAIGADLDRDDIVAAEPKVAKGDAVGDMGIGADQDGDVRGALQSALVDVIAGTAEHLGAGDREAGEDRHGRAVAKPTELSRGRSSRSSSQAETTSSQAAADGDVW